MQNRIRPYDVPHKALRNALSQLSLLAGKTNYAEPKEVEHLYHLGGDVFKMLTVHADSENEVVLAELEERCPGSTAHDMEDHAALHGPQHNLESALKDIYNNSQEGQDIAAAGAEFYLALSEFHSVYLAHTAEEERVTQPLLWKYFSDEELMGHAGKIMSKMHPEMLLKWFRFILAAQSHPERVAILSVVKKTAPPHFFEEVLDIASKVLSPVELENLKGVVA
jgi:hypothetical protein